MTTLYSCLVCGDDMDEIPQVCSKHMVARCRHCERTIVNDGGTWIDPYAMDDDIVWREVCDRQDTFHGGA